MLEKDSYVMYGDNGVCQVVDKRKQKFGTQYKEFYILKPVNNAASTFYVPTDNEALLTKMRDILTKDEVVALIKEIADESLAWVDDNRERQAMYDDIFKSGDRKELLLLIKSLYQHKQDRQADGKKLWTIDENAMKHAEKLVYEEFATVLDIQLDDVVPFIMDIIENK